MTQKQVEQINFEDKYKILKEVKKRYNFAQNLLNRDIVKIDDKQRSLLEMYALVNSILDIMKKDYKEIILNTFLDVKEKNWWNQYYDSFEYKIKRNLAINKFTYYLLV